MRLSYSAPQIKHVVAELADLHLTWDMPCKTATQYKLFRSHVQTRDEMAELNLATFLTRLLCLQDREDTLACTWTGVRIWLDGGYQHSRRLPVGLLIRVPFGFLLSRAQRRRYPRVGRLFPGRENGAINRALSGQPYLRRAARTLP